MINVEKLMESPLHNDPLVTDLGALSIAIYTRTLVSRCCCHACPFTYIHRLHFILCTVVIFRPG